MCVASGAWVLGVGRLANAGMDLQDGIRTLLDVRFADDILFFAKTIGKKKCGRTGGVFGRNGAAFERRKNKKFNNSATKSKRHVFEVGKQLKSLHRGFTHKWLGCMLCTANTGNHTSDLAHHLQAASQAFYAHRPVLVKRNVTTRDRFKYLTPSSPVAGFHC